jgi:hypothetical protein
MNILEFLVFTRLTRHDLTETTRAMVKRGSDDLKKLATLQATLVCILSMIT